MAEDKKSVKEDGKRIKVNTNSSSGALYGLGIIGAAVYFLQHATSFWIGVLGIIKAVFWPALIVYRVLEILKM